MLRARIKNSIRSYPLKPSAGTPPFSFGNALQFDGVNDYVSFGGSNVLADPNSAWSVGLWFKLDANLTFQTLLRLRSGTASQPFGVITSNIGGYSDISFGSNGTFYRGKISFSMTTATWYYLTITFDGVSATSASSYTVYINGVSQSITASGAFVSFTDESILGATNTGGILLFDGIEDEIAFWQQELTPTEVSNQWNGGNGNFADIDVTPLVWFRMNESGTDTTAVNSGSGGATYDGTLNNFPASGMWVAH